LKNKNSILTKQIIAYFTIIIILISVTTFISANLIKKNHIEYLIKTLKYSNSLISNIITPNDILIKKDSIEKRIRKLTNKNQFRITIISADGTVISDTQKNSILMDNHLNREEIMRATNDTIAYAIRYNNTTKKQMIYVAKAIIKNNKIIGFIRSSSYISDADNFLYSLYKNIAIITIIFIVLALIASFIISKKFTNRILRIIQHADKIKNRDFSYLIEVEKNDELDQLVMALNKISSQFKYSFETIEFERFSFEKMISVMKEGVIVYNLQQETITSNNSFNSIYSGNLLTENIKYNEFYNLIKETKSYEKKSLLINNRHYKASGVYYSINNEERIIIVFNDITELKVLEQVKSDFITNVAHELKTPLTSIYGFTETLEDELDDKHSYFLSIIKRNTKRLMNIVSDLISLAYIENIESSNKKITISDIHLKKFTSNINEIFLDKTKDKNIKLSFHCDDDQIVKADIFLLEHIFINLISNAIKYNNENGFIDISIEDKSDRVIINFRDNGIGISEENLTRIFERFYVTDKSRAKSSGGTGLGLAIVKHIVQLHKGEISVKSKINEGSTFSISFFK